MIEIRNYKQFKNVSFDIENSSWVFIVGENGSGKTNLLQAITIALSSNNPRSDMRENKTVCKYKTNDKYSTGVDYSLQYDPILSKQGRNVAAFGVYRASKFANTNRFKSDKDSIMGNSQYLPEDIDEKLYHLKGTPLYDVLVLIICACVLNDKGKHNIDFDFEQKRMIYSFNGNNGVSFYYLPQSYRSIINLLGSIVLQLYEGDMQNASLKSVREMQGFVIIDDIDAHLHPKMQRFLVEKLSKLFPKLRFIVSTNSAIPLLGAPQDSIILRVDRDKESGAYVRRLDNVIDWQNLTINTLITSPVFDSDCPLSNRERH